MKPSSVLPVVPIIPIVPVILIVLDGFGVNSETKWNAVANAQMPTYQRLLKQYPHDTLNASESYVGLPGGFMGNSEVGHLNIGAGRIVFQDFSLISRSIEDGSFYKNPVSLDLAQKVKSASGALHLVGLVSDGGVHSHISHLLSLLDFAKVNAVERVWIHAITDGRDTSPTAGRHFVKTVQDYCQKIGVGQIATVSGRFFAMDRDKHWDRTARAYGAIVRAEGNGFSSASEYVEASYPGVTDEFLEPGVRESYRGVKVGDGVFFFNFRADRAKQLARALTQADFSDFEHGEMPKLSGFVCMTPYEASLGLAKAFEKPAVPSTLGEIVAKRGWRQLRIAETEKYAHVTYFFNGGVEAAFPGETRVLVNSPRDVKTYDLKPEMSAREVTEKLLEELEKGYQFVLVNFANPDMVGHTGVMPAAIAALEVVDECLGKIVAWIEANGVIGILTADHGNCEKMRGDDGQPLTSHTLLPVPLVVVDTKRKLKLKSGGRLCDIAPTILALWGVKQPSEMTGRSLVESISEIESKGK